MLITAQEIISELELQAIPEKKESFPKFFKTAKGEYAEGDAFLGVTVPVQRKLVQDYALKILRSELLKLLKSPYHEVRHCGVLMLVTQFEKSKTIEEKETVVDFYLQHRASLNNWDLVDASCYKILGRFAYETSKAQLLTQLAEEESLWEKRMAVVGSLYYIKKESYELPERLILKNMNHPHDLMHKANGWMLREIGKKSPERLLEFLQTYYKTMPRTTLRYAIEKLSTVLRKKFLKGEI